MNPVGQTQPLCFVEFWKILPLMIMPLDELFCRPAPEKFGIKILALIEIGHLLRLEGPVRVDLDANYQW